MLCNLAGWRENQVAERIQRFCMANSSREPGKEFRSLDERAFLEFMGAHPRCCCLRTRMRRTQCSRRVAARCIRAGTARHSCIGCRMAAACSSRLKLRRRWPTRHPPLGGAGGFEAVASREPGAGTRALSAPQSRNAMALIHCGAAGGPGADSRQGRPRGRRRHSATMLRSAMIAQSRRVHAHVVVAEGVSEREQGMLRQMVDELGGTLSIYRVPRSELGELLEIGAAGMWYRTYLPELIQDLDRVLYLDSDTIVVDSIEPLWQTDLGPHLLGAVTTVFPSPSGGPRTARRSASRRRSSTSTAASCCSTWPPCAPGAGWSGSASSRWPAATASGSGSLGARGLRRVPSLRPRAPRADGVRRPGRLQRSVGRAAAAAGAALELHAAGPRPRAQRADFRHRGCR